MKQNKYFSSERFQPGEACAIIHYDEVYNATVLSVDEDEKDAICPYHVTVKLGAPIYGTVTKRGCDVYHDAIAARSALYGRLHERLLRYKSEITDLHSLLQFALNHQLYGDMVDQEARLAFTMRADELGYPLDTQEESKAAGEFQ